MKRLAVVGAGGFVGARFVELATLNPAALGSVEILPLIRQPRGLGRLSKLGLTQPRYADAARPETLAPAFTGCDAVVNLTMGDDARTLPDARNLHAACAAANVPLLIHLSSAEVFGRAEVPGLTDESPWFVGHWMRYAREKGRAEDWLHALPAGSGPAIVTLRPGLIWGPRSPWVTGPAQAIWDGTAFLVDDGKWACNLCHVDNLIHAILAVAQAPKPAPGRYNVGDADRPDWHTYYHGLAGEMGLSKPSFHALREGDFHESSLTRLLALKNSAPARAIKRRIRNATKEKVKFWLLRLDRNLSPPTGEISLRPDVTKQMWWLQTTRHHLSITKFQADFLPKNQLTFAQGMAQTGEWLRFSGFVVDRRG